MVLKMNTQNWFDGSSHTWQVRLGGNALIVASFVGAMSIQIPVLSESGID